MEWNTIPFTNTDKENFVGIYNSENYPIEVGEKRFFPSYISEHFFKQFRDKMWAKELSSGKKLNKDEFSTKLREDVLGSEIKTMCKEEENTIRDKVYEHEGKVKEMIIREGIKESWKQ
jgi:hypothetical protein